MAVHPNSLKAIEPYKRKEGQPAQIALRALFSAVREGSCVPPSRELRVAQPIALTCCT